VLTVFEIGKNERRSQNGSRVVPAWACRLRELARSPCNLACSLETGRPYRVAAGQVELIQILLAPGLTTSHYSKRWGTAGLDFRVRFRSAIYADETIHVEWPVSKGTVESKTHRRHSCTPRGQQEPE